MLRGSRERPYAMPSVEVSRGNLGATMGGTGIKRIFCPSPSDAADPPENSFNNRLSGGPAFPPGGSGGHLSDDEPDFSLLSGS